jgi:CheY-like chemotaxis protein
MTVDAPRRVLFVDDEREQIRLQADHFGRVPDVALVTADSAEEALSTLRASEIDCLVSDSVLTDDGEPLVEVAKRTHPDLPVVLYSGRSPADLPTEVVDGYVPKMSSSRSGTGLETLRDEIRDLTADAGPASADVTDAAPGEWSSLGTFDWAGTRSVSLAILEALADRTDLDLLEGAPLAELVDPDALDALLRHAATTDGSSVTVRFQFREYLVDAAADGTVAYRETATGGSERTG